MLEAHKVINYSAIVHHLLQSNICILNLVDRMIAHFFSSYYKHQSKAFL